MKIDELPQIKEQHEIQQQVRQRAAVAITLLYYFLERQINHAAGNLVFALDVVTQYQELLNFDSQLLYLRLIKLLMQDVRLK